MATSATPRLTDHDRRIIADARLLASLRAGTSDVLEHTGETGITLALANALGQAQHVLRELAAIAERLGAGDA